MNERSWGFPREGSDDMTDRNSEHLGGDCEQGASIRRRGCHAGTSTKYDLESVVPA